VVIYSLGKLRMAVAVGGAGVATWPGGTLVSLVVAGAPADLHDLIRDTASDLGLGLVRLQADHRRIEDVFTDDGRGDDD
jgi:ABC-2 type transport system ATP-binding protein